jgi:hypothetical protein
MRRLSKVLLNALLTLGAFTLVAQAQNPFEELKRRAGGGHGQHHQRPQQAAPAPRVFQAPQQQIAPQVQHNAPRHHAPRHQGGGFGGGFGGGLVIAPSPPVVVDRPVYYEQPRVYEQPQYYQQQQPQYYEQPRHYADEPVYYGRPRYAKRRVAQRCRTVTARDAYGQKYRVKRCAPIRPRYYRT